MKINRKKLKSNILISVTLLISILGIITFSSSLGVYKSSSTGTGKVYLAYSLIDINEVDKSIKLPEIEPDNKERFLNFTVSNYKDDKIIDTNMSFNLTIKTTTNLPIEYHLYDEKNKIIEAESSYIQDEYGTYFYQIQTEDLTFGYTKKETKNYKIGYSLSSNYNDASYQDKIELIDIKINIKQI